MTSRPIVSVRSATETGKSVATVTMPAVLVSPIRMDIVHHVHRDMNKNKRQAYAVNRMAGHQHSAESWGTGRAVSRIPRVSGGGTSRAGQGAFGNMCRHGRMFAPTKTWRRWHRKISVGQRRYALASALAASALPALVQARGHRISKVEEVPLVVEDSVQALKQTKQALAALKTIAADEDTTHAHDSRQVRSGKGKMRNRRHVSRKGPLVVYHKDDGIVKAFRGLSVDVSPVSALNLLELAPGGHLGRFVIWTKSAFAELDNLYGTYAKKGSKKGFQLARPMVNNADIGRIINSDEVQSVVRPAIKSKSFPRRKANPLKNDHAMHLLNPADRARRRAAALANKKGAEARKAAIEAARAGKKLAKDDKTKKHTAAKKAAKKAFVATIMGN